MLRLLRRHHSLLALVAGLFIAATAAFALSAKLGAVAIGTCGSPRAVLDGEEQTAVSLVNAYRAEHGLGQLRPSPVLSGIGAWMLGDVAASGRVEHTDSLGRSAYERSVACGYNGGAGENLAAGADWDSAREALAAWKASPAHNDNLLSRYYSEIGVARLHRSGSAYGWYWAVEFGAGTAASSPAAASILTAPGLPAGGDLPHLNGTDAEAHPVESAANPQRPWRLFVVNY